MAYNAGEAVQRAVLQALLGVSGITSILGHTSNNLRIGYGYPDIAGKLPFLCYVIQTKLQNKNLTRFKKSKVIFYACDNELLTTTRISDIIEGRLVGDPTIESENKTPYFWNISNAGVGVKDFQFLNRFELAPTEKPKVFCTQVTAQLLWMDVACNHSPLDCLEPLQ